MRLPPHIAFLLRVYLLLVAACTAFRILLFAVVWRDRGLGDARPGEVLTAFVIGWRFDTVVAMYLLALPFLVLSVAHLAGSLGQLPWRAVRIWLFITVPLVLFACAADIPFFLHFFARLNMNALLWSQHAGYMFRLVIEEPSYWLYAIPFALATWLMVRAIARSTHRPFQAGAYRRVGPWVAFVVCGGTIFLGMRGRTDEKSPIQQGSAYFCDDPFLNQLGLNPAFTFGTSFAAKLSAPRTLAHRMPDEEAIHFAVEQLHAVPEPSGSPIARPVEPVAPIERSNVVVILMESMSTYKMGEFNGPKGLTPFLNDLGQRSLRFTRIASAGIHTFNGIYSTLFSFPALFDQQPMEDELDTHQAGLGSVLRAHGWGTVFFTTHDPEFDNMKGFLLAHGFDRIISEDDYPQEWVASTNGVPDHRMFEYAVPQLTALAAKGPFLSVFMTTSDHKPYLLPKDFPFTPRSERIEDAIVEYADRSIQHFFELARKEPWYANTVFVVLADHGINMGHTYDMPLSFHRIPLIVHSPAQLFEPRDNGAIGGQIDVAPTLLGLLNVPWTNTTMGIDLLREQRPYIYFCADDRVGCMDSTHYSIRRPDGRSTLYRFAQLSTEDLSTQLPAKKRAMEHYADAMMTTTQWLIQQDLLDGGPSHRTRP